MSEYIEASGSNMYDMHSVCLLNRREGMHSVYHPPLGHPLALRSQAASSPRVYACANFGRDHGVRVDVGHPEHELEHAVPSSNDGAIRYQHRATAVLWVRDFREDYAQENGL